ncbi:hypothetical protein A6D6_00848 [Alcanivorax xiamenensis]|uniref:Uncharacterized protein n=1 Tax=Alcanivorax xiamenensis TaxID=1177156 RepID=A0ABQ6YB95_9GAMM|nr:hypothetical protein [Alcanivorax xiamenensis]KAF0807296.1 hypothetical protein A6D6_00848 [Alcanivorax xiamenensis]
MKPLLSIATILGIFTLQLGAGAMAGTPGLTGAYYGDYLIQVRTTDDNTIRATGLAYYDWDWDFDNAEMTITNGQVNASFLGISGIFNYALTDISSGSTTIPFTDNGDGTYSFNYNFKVFNPLFGNPNKDTGITLEITDSGGVLIIDTIDSDGDGVIGHNLPASPFPANLSIELTGSAY